MTCAPAGASRALALICLAAAAAQAIAAAASDPAEIAAAAAATPTTNPCETKCDSTYSPHTSEAATSEWSACKRGCRFLGLGSSLLDSSSGAAAERCEHSCQSAFPWADSAGMKGAYACKLGCGYARPQEDARRKQVATEVENFFGARRFPIMNLRLPDLFNDRNWNDSPFFSSGTRAQSSSLGGIFDQVQREMKDMMKNFHSTFRTIRRQDSPIAGAADDSPLTSIGGRGGGGGKLVVISSGPGYREEKTYNIGSSANGGDANPVLAVMNDMLTKFNPLDDWFGPSSDGDGDSSAAVSDAADRIAKDVEVFQPIHVEIVRGSPFSAQRPVENHKSETVLSNKKDIFAPFAIEVEAKEELSGGGGGGAEDTVSRSGADGYNYEGEFMEGPRLPASGGLRTRVSASDQRPFVVVNRNFCERGNENMKWSDWVSCLHVRIGMPRWLTAATISLGIVFVLWLCLVIPTAAPKQKVKAKPIATKDSKSALAKHLEACSGVSVISVPPASEIKRTPVDVVKQPLADPPPAYDDVAAPQLTVKLDGGTRDVRGGATPVPTEPPTGKGREPNESEA